MKFLMCTLLGLLFSSQVFADFSQAIQGNYSGIIYFNLDKEIEACNNIDFSINYKNNTLILATKIGYSYTSTCLDPHAGKPDGNWIFDGINVSLNQDGTFSSEKEYNLPVGEDNSVAIKRIITGSFKTSSLYVSVIDIDKTTGKVIETAWINLTENYEHNLFLESRIINSSEYYESHNEYRAGVLLKK